MTDSSRVLRSAGALPTVVGVAGVAVGAALAHWGGTLMTVVDAVASSEDDRPTYPLVVVLAGAIVGIGVPLAAIGWYLRRRMAFGRHAPHRVGAVWIGIAWGTVAMLVAGPLNAVAMALPVPGIYPGFIEELLKLLLPVVLLLSSRAYRSPLLGAWLVFVVAAWFALLEGISYIVSALDPILDGGEAPPDAAFIMTMDVIVRIIAALSHPLMTVGAAIIIWRAASSGSRGRALGVGVLGYLGAAAIHGLNDAVLDGPVRDASVPLSIALTAVYVVAILVLWFRPQVLRLTPSAPVGDDAAAARAEPSERA